MCVSLKHTQGLTPQEGARLSHKPTNTKPKPCGLTRS